MSNPHTGRLLRLFGSSVIDQAMLSGANLLVGLILIRYTPQAQYGYYVLAFNAMMLITTLQGTFIGTPMVIRLPSLDQAARRQWVGGLWRDQRRWMVFGAAAALVGCGLAWAGGGVTTETAPVVLAAIVLILAAVYREYFRSILLMYQRPHAVLVADAVYAIGLVAGSGLAMHHPSAAAVALLASAASALVCGRLLRRALGNDIDPAAAPGRLREIARVGMWAASGGVIYWLFNQGYSFLAAATLDITAVAALAGTRLLMMPINLLSAGVQKQLAPIASDWLHTHGPRQTLRRLAKFSLVMGLIALLYSGVVWWLRDWIFSDILRKEFAQRDTLLLLWSVIFMMMVVRDPLMLLTVLRQRFRMLTAATLVCAVISLLVSYWCMQRLGVTGALIGIIAGELCYLGAVLGLALHGARLVAPGAAGPATLGSKAP